MSIDHLRKFLNDIIESVVVAPGGVTLTDLLVQGGQPEQSHDVGVRVLDRDVQCLLVFLVPKMMIRAMFEKEADLTCVPVQGGQM